jgi:glutamate/tyrosine decarboxylase-like PLP-dependent enzyme
MPDKSPLDRQSEETPALLRSAFDHITSYVSSTNSRRVYPAQDAIDRLADLDTPISDNGVSSIEVLSALMSIGGNAIPTTTGGRFFGFVSGGVLPVGLAARLVADAWDQGSALYSMSPLAAELERVCEAWLLDLFKLPKESTVGFVTGASMANFCAFVAARDTLLERAGWNLAKKGLIGAPRLRVVVNENAHSSVWRGLRLCGFGEEQIEKALTDTNGRILPDKLPHLDDRTLLILQAGDVNTGSFDDFSDLCSRANAVGTWTHVDGAFGLWASASAAYSHLTQGVELADSWATDAHKTLNAPYECGVIICRHASEYRRAMATNAAYAPIGDNRDGMALVPEMSRRARSIEMWAIIKSLGYQGVAELVEQLCARATQMAGLLHQQGYQIINDVVFNQVLVKAGDDPQTQRVLEHIQSSGECWCGGTRWKGQAAIRFSVSSWATTEEDIHRAAAVFAQALNW